MEFSIDPLSPTRIRAIKKCKEWSDDCPVPLARLVKVSFIHLDFQGNEQIGRIIVLDALGESVMTIFKELLQRKFPIEKAIPVDFFAGDDVASMNANNSSAFNCRRVMNTDRWSSHAYGAAIDINPVQNPYVLINEETHTARIYPIGGAHFLNRHLQESGMVEPIVSVFADHGFTDWGGAWRAPLDYHHFQVPWEKIHQLV